MKGAHFITYFLAGAIPRLAMFVILFVLARRISITETGLFTLVITVGETVEMVSANWLRVYIQAREAGQARIRALRGGRILTLAAGMYGLAVVANIPMAWIVAPDRIGAFFLAVLMYVTAFALLRLVLAIQQVTHNHAIFARIELTRGLLVMAGVVAVTFVPGATFFEPAMVLCGVTFAAAAVGMYGARRQMHRPRLIARGYRAAFRFGVPIVADTVFGFVILYLDRLILNEYLGPASVGIYAIAFALGRQPVDFITGPLNNLTVPVLFTARAREGEDRARAIQSGVSITMFVLCAGAFTGILLLRAQIAQLFVGPELAADTAWLIPVITAASCILVFKIFLYDNLFFMTGRNGLKLKAVMPAAITGAIAAFVLIRAYGLAGAALSSVLSASLALLASFLATRTFFRFPLPVARFAMIALAAAMAGLALEGAVLLVRDFGLVAQMGAGFVGFCVVYALGLAAMGIPLKRLISTPWDPVQSVT